MHVPVSVHVPVSLQLSAVLSEGRPQVPGVPRGVVAHSSGSRSQDAFCRRTPERLELLKWTDGGREAGESDRLTCSDRLEQEPVKSSMSDLEPPSRSSRMRSVGILPFRQVM